MPDKLQEALDATGYRFAPYGWSHSPSGDYGTFAPDGANDLYANDSHAEKAIEGTVDYFTRDATGTPQAVIEAALESIEGCAWYLNSVQFEDSTGYIHFEWVVQVA